MKWNKALLLSLATGILAISGFFAGVTLGSHSKEANSWVLAITAGEFIYIAMLDLVRV